MLANCSPWPGPRAEEEAGPLVQATPAPTNQTTQAKTRIWFAGSEGFEQAYQPLIEQFNKQSVDIEVQFIAIETILGQNASAMSREQRAEALLRAADTVALSSLTTENKAVQPFLYDLKPFILATPAFNTTDFLPAIRQALDQPSVYQIPDTFYLPLFAYNREQWQRAGVVAPGANSTWAEIVDAAERAVRLQQDKTDVFALAGSPGVLQPVLGELTVAGVDIEQVLAGNIQFDDPTVAAALERAATLVRDKQIVLTAQASQSQPPFDPVAAFNEQRLGLWLRDVRSLLGLVFVSGDTPPTQPPASADSQLGPGVVVLPEALASVGTTTTGYGISRGTQHPEAAWEWLAFLSAQNTPVTPLSGLNLTPIPARQSLAERIKYWEQFDAESATVIRAAAEQTTTASQQAQARSEALQVALSDVLAGQAPATALTEAEAALVAAEQQVVSVPAPFMVPAPPAAPERSAATVTFGVSDALGDSVDTIQRVADQFNRQNEQGIRVEVINVRLDGQMFPTFAQQSDCFISTGIGSNVQSSDMQAVLDLRPLIEADGAFALTDYSPGILAPFMQNNVLTGLPVTAGYRVLHYNRVLFDRVGVEYPRPNWTMDNLVDAAQRLTQSEGANQQYGFASLVPLANDLTYATNQAGMMPWIASEDGVQPRFTDAQVVQGIQRYVDLLSYAPSVQPQNASSDNINDVLAHTMKTQRLIESGQVAMWFNSPELSFTKLADSLSLQHAIAAPPLDNRPVLAHDLAMRGLYVSAQNEQPAACWSWMKHLVNNPGWITRGIPAKASTVDATFFQATPPGASEAWSAYQNVLGLPNNDVEREMDKINFRWLDQAAAAAAGGKPLEPLLERAQQVTQEVMDCASAEGAITSECEAQYGSVVIGA